jgi:hypothetical protein
MEGKKRDWRKTLINGWNVSERISVIHDVKSPVSIRYFSLARQEFLRGYRPFHKANHPSVLYLPTLFIIPHTPPALPTGIIYSGLVPSSRTDRRTMWPCSSTIARGAGGRLVWYDAGPTFEPKMVSGAALCDCRGSAKYESASPSCSSSVS